MKEDVELTLFHGSYTEVSCPDLKQCRHGKDFGRGFYLTSSRKQAEKFTRTAIKKALKDADSAWLHCVAAHRKKGTYPDVIKEYKDYDIIIGKIANDNTNLVITAYLDGIYGDIPSERADEIAISFLKPDNLKDQFCFRTEKALRSLRFIESYEVKL